jgi:hypothetical protein
VFSLITVDSSFQPFGIPPPLQIQAGPFLAIPESKPKSGLKANENVPRYPEEHLDGKLDD